MKLAEEQDQWNALVHEIGHALVAHALGHEATWHVYPARTRGARSWEGATALPTDLPLVDRRLMALAGAVSEILIGVIPFSFEPSDLATAGMLLEYKFSGTDAEYMGRGWRPEEALRCIKMVRDLKPQIVKLAIASGGAVPPNRLRNGAEA